MKDNLLDALRSVLLFVPKLVLFLVILLVGYFVAKALGKAVNKVLDRVGFNRAVERGGVGRALSRSEYEASGIIGKVVFYFLMLFVLQLAFGVFGNNPISDLINRVVAFLPQLFVALIIIVVAAAIAAGARELIKNTLGGLSYGKTLANVAGAFIIGLGIIAALNQIGVAVTVTTPILIAVLATVAGILVVGVGGGLIKPMQQRWEGYLQNAEDELPRIKEEAAAAPSIGEQASQAKDRAQQLYDQHTQGGQPTSYGSGQGSYAEPNDPGGQHYGRRGPDEQGY